jgi:hypothetical protein
VTRPWLPYPAATIRRPPCPTGQPRHTSQHLANLARLPGMHPAPPPEACGICGGWHNRLENAA